MVEIAAADGVATLRINRPERRNALDLETWRSLERCIDDFERDDDLQVGVLTGAAGVFSAGGDIRASIVLGTGVASRAGRLRVSHRVLQRLRSCEKPVIAAVESYALGMGFSVALACDCIIASRSSYFAAPHARRGLVPDGGVVWSLVNALGRSAAMRHLVLGDELSVETAHAAGLVYEIVDDGEAERAAGALALQLMEGPADVIALTRRLIRAADDSSYESFLREEFVAVALNMYGGDAAEGLAAFAERRTPNFARARDSR